MNILRVGGLTAATSMMGFTAALGTAPAQAQPVNQDGLINVAVGDVTILEDRGRSPCDRTDLVQGCASYRHE